jgi:hypothetical protein
MIQSRSETYALAGLSLRDSLALCFCAAGIVISTMLLRMPLHIPGHRVFPVALFLLVGRTSVRSGWTGTAIGIFSGLALLSLRGETPSHVAQYAIAGLIADSMWRAARQLPSMVTLVIAGALIGASWLPVPLLMNQMLGLGSDQTIWAVAIKNGWAICFGAAGGALAFVIGKRLDAVGLMPDGVPRRTGLEPAK